MRSGGYGYLSRRVLDLAPLGNHVDDGLLGVRHEHVAQGHLLARVADRDQRLQGKSAMKRRAGGVPVSPAARGKQDPPTVRETTGCQGGHLDEDTCDPSTVREICKPTTDSYGDITGSVGGIYILPDRHNDLLEELHDACRRRRAADQNHVDPWSRANQPG